eukprot:tig00000459_g1122.t1
MIDRGAPVSGPTLDGVPLLVLACSHGMGPAVVRRMLERGADANEGGGRGVTPLAAAAARAAEGDPFHQTEAGNPGSFSPRNSQLCTPETEAGWWRKIFYCVEYSRHGQCREGERVLSM